MCDYSLQGLPNRLAVEGEKLVTHRFPLGPWAWRRRWTSRRRVIRKRRPASGNVVDSAETPAVVASRILSQCRLSAFHPERACS